MLLHHYNPAALALYELDKPVVASIHGIAAGAGAALALGCDLRVAAESAPLAILFRRVGFALDAGASFHLQRLVGGSLAAELALLGEDISASRALAIGLVNYVVPDAELTDATRNLARRLADGPYAQGQIKRQLRAAAIHDLGDQLAFEADVQGAVSKSHDCVEGVQAFLQRRTPQFTGR
jgi:2-(1,2-epoxy-1,2-dihydrophenyl)acetyl-CoA isomerase